MNEFLMAGSLSSTRNSFPFHDSLPLNSTAFLMERERVPEGDRDVMSKLMKENNCADMKVFSLS